jgi:hypothetical protein
MNEKIYQPYFISNNTIIQYQDNNEESVSLMEIIESYIKLRKINSKLYFKVNMAIQNKTFINPSIGEIGSNLSKVGETHLDLHYLNNEQGNSKIKRYEFQYFEFELK